MGIPKVQVRRRSKIKGPAQFNLESDRATVVFEEMDEELSFPLQDDYILFDWTSVPTGRCHAEVSGDKERLLTVRPLSGTYFVRLREFVSGEGQIPQPRHYEIPVEGGKRLWTFDAFDVLLEIQNGSWEGTVIPTRIHYLFTDSGDGETAGIKTGSSKAEELVQFLDASGLDFDTDTIPLSENVLPWLERTLLERQQTFLVVLEGSYPTSYAPAP